MSEWKETYMLKLMCGYNKNRLVLIVFLFWSASGAEQQTQLWQAGIAWEKSPPLNKANIVFSTTIQDSSKAG